VGQNFPQALPKTFLMQKVRPHDHAPVRRQPLIGERNPNGRSRVFGVNWQAHRLVRLWSRFGNLFWFHHLKPAKRCTLFQAESFRLRRQPSWLVWQEIDRRLRQLPRAETGNMHDKYAASFGLYVDILNVDKRIADIIRQAARICPLLKILHERIPRQRGFDGLVLALRQKVSQ